MSFFEELKRRKVFRVAASYAVVAFIIMQLVEIVFPIFDFPQWTSQFVIIIVLLGFPIAIVLSWIFDKTPEGFIKTDLQQKEEVGGMNLNFGKPVLFVQNRHKLNEARKFLETTDYYKNFDEEYKNDILSN